ncbi:MAG: hypothetical protein PHQ72_06365 [Hespellia sp.]|nr:hypothetical protein [Hespellia sp.]
MKKTNHKSRRNMLNGHREKRRKQRARFGPLLFVFILLSAWMPVQAEETEIQQMPAEAAAVSAPVNQTTVSNSVTMPTTTEPTTPTTTEPTTPTTPEPTTPTTPEPTTPTTTEPTTTEPTTTPGTTAATSQAVSALAEEGGTTAGGSTELSTGLNETTEDYSVPEGSAYIYDPENGLSGDDLSYENDASANAIQNSLETAIKYATTIAEDKTATIVVKNGTYMGGITIDRSSESTLGKILLQMIADKVTEGMSEEDAKKDAESTIGGITIRIVAEDALGENGEILTTSAGNVEVQGAIDISGLNVILAGIYLSTNGTIGIANTDAFTYYGTAKEDNVSINLDNVSKEITVDGGAGDDNLSVTVRQAPNFTINLTKDLADQIAAAGKNISEVLTTLATTPYADWKTTTIGEGENEMTLWQVAESVAGSLLNILKVQMSYEKDITTNVSVNGGAGNDQINVKLINSTNLTSGFMTSAVEKQNDPDTTETPAVSLIDFKLDLSKVLLSLNGDAGNDRLNVSGGMSLDLKHMFLDILREKIMDYIGTNTESLLDGDSSVIVNGGTGDDVLTIDTTTGYSSYRNVTYQADGGSGYDRLHLTGKLEANKGLPAGETNLSVTPSAGSENRTDIFAKTIAELTFASLSIGEDDLFAGFSLTKKKDMAIQASGMESYTDALANKNSVELSAEGMAADKMASSTIANVSSYTDYILQAVADGDISHVNYEAIVSGTFPILYFTNLVIRLADGTKELVIDKLLAAYFNILASAEKIRAEGELTGRNILLRGETEDAWSVKADLVTSDLNDSIAEEEGGDSDLGFSFTVEAPVTDINITIGKDASVTASEAIDLNVSSVQEGFYLSLDVFGTDIFETLGLNLLSFKSGSATIDILGTLKAAGLISAVSEVVIISETTWKTLGKFIPVSAHVALVDSHIAIGGKDADGNNIEGTSITSEQASILVKANSYTKLDTLARAGIAPLSLAVDVVVADTYVTVAGNALLKALTDIFLSADTVIHTTALATGAPVSELATKPSSGAFIAVIVIENDTYVKVTDDASLDAGNDMKLNSISNVSANSAAISAPSDAKKAIRAKSIIQCIESLLGVKQADNTPMFSKGNLITKLTGSNFLGNLLNGGTQGSTEPKEGETEPKATTQFVGAFDVNAILNDNFVQINTNGKVNAGGTLDLIAYADTISYAKADGSLYKNPSLFGVIPVGQEPDNAIGIGTAVVYYEHQNRAFIGADPDESSEVNAANRIEAAELNVKALTGRSISSAISKAGHVPSKKAELGIGGAITVQVASDQTTAAIYNGTYTIGTNGTAGDINVIASAEHIYTTVADASGKRNTVKISLPAGFVIPITQDMYNKEGTGIGAGIAVYVGGGDVEALISDGVQFTSVPGAANGAKADDVTVSADRKTIETVIAEAGAGSGKAVAPVIATAVSGYSAESLFGFGSSIQDYYTGNVTVSAENQVIRKIKADAKAIGVSAGAGGSFAVVVVNDSSNASLKRNVNAVNIHVVAKGIDRVTIDSKASATGANPATVTGQSGSQTPGTAAEIISKIKDLINSGSSSGSTGGESSAGGSTAAQQNEKGEADKVADKNIGAAKDLSNNVNSKNINADKIDSLTKNRQQASTSEGNVQVAAAFAVNVMQHTVEALIADGLILTARKVTGEEESGALAIEAVSDTDGVIKADASATKSQTGIGVAAAVNIVNYKNRAVLGDSRLNAGKLTITADTLEAADSESLEEILSTLITFLAASTEGNELLLDILDDQLGENVTLDSLIAAKVAELNADGTLENQEAIEAAEKEVKADLVSEIVNRLTGEKTKETTSDLVQAVVESLVKETLDTFLKPENLLNMIFTGENGALQDMKDKLSVMGEVAVAKMERLMNTYLRMKFGSNDEMDGVGSRISTTAISGAGASNLGIAGAVSVTVINALTEAVIADHDGNRIEEDLKISGDVTIYGRSVQDVYTTATGAADKKGQADKNKNPVASSDSNGDNSSSKSVGVGAAAATTVIDTTVNAGIGEKRTLRNDGNLTITGLIYDDVETIAVAGSDPIARRQKAEEYVSTLGADVPQIDKDKITGANTTGTKDISVDASAAVGIIDNKVNVFIGRNTKVTTLKDLTLLAEQHGETLAGASAFAVGSDAAVGACASINLPESLVTVLLAGDVTSGGKTTLKSYTYDEDESHAYAAVTGASFERYLDKIRDMLQLGSLNSGTPTNGLNAKLMNKLNGTVSGVKTGAGSALSSIKNYLPASVAALFSQGASTGETPSASSSGAPGSNAMSQAGSAAGQSGASVDAGTDSSAKQGQSINIAAAVAVNVTMHKAIVQITGTLHTIDAELKAENHGNFRTLGTGAAVTGTKDTNANNISLGVAVSTNKNEAQILIDNDVIASGDVKMDAVLTQNMDGVYRGLLGAQALAGSISGNGGVVGISGAVAILIGDTKTKVIIADGVTLEGKAVTINAEDKSKYAVRAGSVTISKGATAGVGASYAMIYAGNETMVLIGEDAADEDKAALKGTNITADSLQITVKKVKVDSSDYKFPFDTSTLLTVDVVKDSEKGLINLTTTDGTAGKYSVDITLSSDDFLKVIDMMNYLASVNYYAEAIAGSILTSGSNGESKAAVAGSMAMVYLKNVTTAVIGDKVTITLRGGDLDITVSEDTNTRMISGALSASSAKVGVGASITTLVDTQNVSAKLSDDVVITTSGNVKLHAENKADVLVITVAAAGSTASGGATVGGAVNVVDHETYVYAGSGANNRITAKNIEVSADSTYDVKLINASAAVTQGVAVGGTVAVILTDNTTIAEVLNDNTWTANGAVLVRAASKEELLNILASISGSTGKVGVAGTLGVIIADSQVEARLQDRVKITAADNISLTAEGNVKQLMVLAAATASGGDAAVGATVTVDVFSHMVHAVTGDGCILISQNGDVLVQATGKDEILIVTVAGGLTSGTAGIAGAIPVITAASDVKAEIGTSNQVSAKGSVGVIADLISDIYNIAGSVAGGSKVGIGATVSTLVMENQVVARIMDYTRITALALTGSGIKIPNRTERRNGLAVYSNLTSDLLMASISGAVAGNVSVGGVVDTIVMNNLVTSSIGNHVSANAREVRDKSTGSITSSTKNEDADADGDVHIEAYNQTHLYHFAGAVSVGSTAGVGATVAVTIFNNITNAQIGDGCHIYARDIKAVADSTAELVIIIATFGASGTAAVAGAASVVLFDNETRSTAGAAVKLQALRDITIHADSDNKIFSIAAALAGSGTAAVGAVAPVVKFTGTTVAGAGNGAALRAGGNVSVLADSKEDIDTYGAGAAGSGTAAVAGTIEVLITQLTTKAYLGDSVTVDADNIYVKATDHYTLTGVAGAVAASGAAAVGLSVLVSLSYNTVQASVGRTNKLTAKRDIQIRAESGRDISVYAVTAGASGSAAVAGTVVVVLAGAKLTADSAETIKKNNQNVEMDLQTQVSYALGATGNKKAQGYSDKAEVGSFFDESNIDKNANSTSGAVDGSDFTLAKENGNTNGNSDSAEDKYTVSDSQVDTAANDTYRPEPGEGKQDATLAFVGAGSVLIAGNDIEIHAKDMVSMDLLTIAAAVSGGGSVGIGVTVGILYSNVLAYTEESVTLDAKRNITVQAEGSAVERTISDNNKSVTNKLDKDKKPADTYTIRSLTISGTGGIAGVSIPVASIDVYTVTKAYVGTDNIIRNAVLLTVEADSNYGKIVVWNLGLAAGVAGVTASVTRANYNAVVSAYIGADTTLYKVGTIQMEIKSDTTLETLGAALAAGVAGVNATVILAFYTADMELFIGQGVRGVDCGTITMLLTARAEATAKELSITAGAVGVGVSVVMVKLTPTFLNYIGRTPNGYALNADSVSSRAAGERGSIELSSLNMKSDITSKATVIGLSASAAGVAANGLVALAINRTNSVVGISGANVSSTGDIEITGLLDANSDVDAAAVTGAVVGVGAMAGYAELKTVNQAFIDLTEAVVTAQNVKVQAGIEDSVSKAETTITTGSVAGVSVTINIALASNAYKNYAGITGAGGTLKAAGDITVLTHGKAITNTEIHGVSVAVTAVGAALAYSYLKAVSIAEIAGSTVTGRNISITSNLNNTDGYTVTSTAFAAGVALIGINGAVALSISEAENLARASGNIKASGTLTVQAIGNARAMASAEDYTAGYVTVGLRFATAIARGRYAASIERNKTDQIEAKELLVQTLADTDAYSVTKAASGGVSASYASVNINSAYAETSSNISAFITETEGAGAAGYLNIKGDAQVQAVGNGRAVADTKGTEAAQGVNASVYKLAASNAYANMNTVMKAYIKKQSAMSVKGDLNVLAYLNHNINAETAKTNRTNGAYATAGANSASVSLIGAEISNAYAKQKAEVLASVEQSNLDVTGVLAILTNANQLVYAQISSNNFGLAGGIGAINTTAWANGTYQAKLSVNSGNTVHAGSLQIAAVLGTNTAKAETEYLSGGLINVSILSAEAFNNAVVSAYLTGDKTGKGTLTVDKNTSITASATNTVADAAVSGMTVASGVKVGNAYTHTKLNGRVEAYTDGNVEIVTGGAFTVEADQRGTSTPKSTNSVGITLIGVSGAESFAESTMVTKASLGNSSSSIGGNVVIRAYGTSVLTMTNEKGGTELLGLGAMIVKTRVSNSILAAIQKAAVLQAKGDINVTAEGRDKERLTSESTTSGLLNGQSVIVQAVSNSAVSVTVGDGAQITATGTITIDGYNTIDVSVKTLDRSVSGVKLGAYVVTTNTTSKVQTAIGRNAGMWADGDINIFARDRIDVTNETILQFGGLAGGTASVITNHANQSTRADIADGASIRAAGNIEIGAFTDYRMNVSCRDSSITAASAVAVEVYNGLTRNCITVIGNDVRIISEKGNITIFANSVPSTAGNIETDGYAMTATATGTAAGLFNASGAKAENVLNSNTQIIIGNGGLIQATYGNIAIMAQTGSSIYSYAYRKAAAAISASVAAANITLKNPVSVVINGTAEKKANIIGSNVEIAAVNAYQKLQAEADTLMYAAGAVSKANVTVAVGGDAVVDIHGANIRGYDSVYIHAEVAHIKHNFTTHSEIVGAVGVVYATTVVSGGMQAKVNTDGNTEIASADVDIEASAPKLSSVNHVATADAVANTILAWVFKVIAIVVKWVMKAVSWFVGLFSKKAKQRVEEKVYGWVKEIKSTTAYPKETDTFAMDTVLNLNGKISIGGAAAGIVVDIDKNAGVMVVGVEDAEWLNNIRIDHEKKTITIPYIYNRAEGSLSLDAGDGLLYGNLAVYLNNYLTYITFNNNSDYTLILSDITVFNTDANPIDIAVTARNYNNDLKLSYGNETPVITINAAKGADVILNGEINNVKGSLNFIMNGGNIYVGEGGIQDQDELLKGDTEFLTKMFAGTNIWVNTLSIRGADNVGNSAEERLMIGLIRYSGFNEAGMIPEAAKDAIVDIEILGNLFASFALLETIVSDDTLSDDVLNNMDPIKSLYLKHIKAGGIADIYLPAAKRLYVYKDGTNYEGVEIAYPGEYSDMYLYIPSAAMLNGKEYFIIKDTGGHDTNYILTKDGLFMLNGEVSVDSEIFLDGDLTSIWLGTTVHEVHSYTLPDDTVIYVTSDGTVLMITSKYGNNEIALNMTELNLIKNADGSMQLTFNDSEDDNDSYITLNSDGTGTLHIGKNGLTIAVEQTADGSWELPNGIKIHTMFILIGADKKLVTTTYIGTYGDVRRYLIGNLSTAASDNLYYVFDVKTDDQENTVFVDAYLYKSEKLSDSDKTELFREQTVDEAYEKVSTLVTEALKNMTAEALLAYAHRGSTEVVNPVDALMQAIKEKVTTNIQVSIRLKQLRRIVEETAADGTIRYAAQYRLELQVVLKDLISEEERGGEIFQKTFDLGNATYLTDTMDGINTENLTNTGTAAGTLEREDTDIPAREQDTEGNTTDVGKTESGTGTGIVDEVTSETDAVNVAQDAIKVVKTTDFAYVSANNETLNQILNTVISNVGSNVKTTVSISTKKTSKTTGTGTAQQTSYYFTYTITIKMTVDGKEIAVPITAEFEVGTTESATVATDAYPEGTVGETQESGKKEGTSGTKKHQMTLEEAEGVAKTEIDKVTALTSNTLTELRDAIAAKVDSGVSITVYYEKKGYDKVTRKFKYLIYVMITVGEASSKKDSVMKELEKAALTTSLTEPSEPSDPENSKTIIETTIESILNDLNLKDYLSETKDAKPIVAQDIANKIAAKVDGNIKIKVTLTQVENRTAFKYGAAMAGFAAEVNGYIYNYILTIDLEDISIAGTTKSLTYRYDDKDGANLTAIAKALMGQKWLMGEKPYVEPTQEEAKWDENQTDAPKADGTWENDISAGNGYKPTGLSEELKNSVLIVEDSSYSSNYIMKYGKYSYTIERLQTTELATYNTATYKLAAGTFKNKQEAKFYEILKEYIWCIQNDKLTIYTLKDQEKAKADIYQSIGGDIYFKDAGGSQLVVNRVVAEYPGELVEGTDSNDTKYVYVSLTPASDDVADEERTLANSIVYVSYLINQLKVLNPLKGFTDENGEVIKDTVDVYETLDKSEIYAPVDESTPEDAKIVTGTVDGKLVRYYYVGYIDYLADGTEKYYIWVKGENGTYSYVEFDPYAEAISEPVKPDEPEEPQEPENPQDEDYQEKLEQYDKDYAAYETYMKLYAYYVTMFAADNVSVPIYDITSNIVFDTTKGQGIIITPYSSTNASFGTVYFQNGIDDFKVSMSVDGNGVKYLKISETERIKVKDKDIIYEYLRPVTDEDGNTVYVVYASRNMSQEEMIWYTENGNLTFNTGHFDTSKVTLSRGYTLMGSRVSDNVVTILKGSEYFYIKAVKNTDESGNVSYDVSNVIYADLSDNPDRQIWLIQEKANGIFTEIKKVLSETLDTITVVIADNTADSKQRTVTYQKSDLVGEGMMQAVSIRDAEYNPVMIAIASGLGKYYIFPNGYTIGVLKANFEAVFFISQIVIERFRHTQEVTGSGYRIGDIEAKQVILTFGDEHAVITDEYMQGTTAAITADTIQIFTSTKTPIGTAEKPLRIRLTGQTAADGFYIGNADGTFAGTAVIQAVSGDLTITGTTLKDGATLELISAGDIVTKKTSQRTDDIVVEKGAELILSAAGNIGAADQAFAVYGYAGGKPIQIKQAVNIYLAGGNSTESILDVKLPDRGVSGVVQITNTGDIQLDLPQGNLNVDRIWSTKGDVILTAVNGSILAAAGTTGANVSGHSIVLQAADAVDLATDLISIPGRADGTVKLKAGGDVMLKETSGNMQIAQLETSGNVTLAAAGTISTVGDAVITGKDLSIQAGNLGTAKTSPLKSAVTGELSLVTTGNLYLHQQGNVLVRKLQAGRNILIQTDGNIQAAAGVETAVYREIQDLLRASAEALAAYNQAEAEAKAAENYAQHLNDNIKEQEEKRAAAEVKYNEIQSKITELEEALVTALGDLEEEQRLRAEIDELIPELEAFKQELDAYDAALLILRSKAEDADGEGGDTKTVAEVEAEVKRAQVQAKKEAYEDIMKQLEGKTAELEQAEALVKSAGNMELISGGSIGTADYPLPVEAGGSLSAQGKNIYLGTKKDILLGTVTADQGGGELVIVAGGNIRNLSPAEVLTANSGTLMSLDGNLGTASSPLQTSFNRAQLIGNNIYLSNNKNLTADLIYAEGQAALTILGDLTGAGDGVDILTGTVDTNGSADIHVNGSIGKDTQPLNIQAKNLKLYAGKSVYANLIEAEAVVDTIIAKDTIDVTTTGDLVAKNPQKTAMYAPDIKLHAMGYVGRPGAELMLSTDQISALSDEYQIHIYQSKYEEPKPEPEPEPIPEPKPELPEEIQKTDTIQGGYGGYRIGSYRTRGWGFRVQRAGGLMETAADSKAAEETAADNKADETKISQADKNNGGDADQKSDETQQDAFAEEGQMRSYIMILLAVLALILILILVGKRRNKEE